jgi:hypothetical protein
MKERKQRNKALNKAVYIIIIEINVFKKLEK